jgi:hypothetical protein
MPSAHQNLQALAGYLSRSQLRTLSSLARGEEGAWFQAKIATLANQFATAPRTYAQADQGDAALAHFHYFTASADFYITELDAGSPNDLPEQFQSQAFGLAKFSGGNAELGYLSLPEILAAGAELDLHWTPQPISNLRHQFAAL